MMACNVQLMINSRYDDPSFFVDFYNIGRGLVGKATIEKEPRITRTIQVVCWKIVDDKLEKTGDTLGILFDAETYLIQWTFELFANGNTSEESIFYYWKGNNATKAFSPLPPEIENQNPVVERICQWSEPALFFHMFPKTVIVFSGKQHEFNPNTKGLFIVRGELEQEIHLYELPCLKSNLRSRAVFVLIDPSQKMVYKWYGASASPTLQQFIKKNVNINDCHVNWSNFKETEVNEGQDELFLELLGPDKGSFISVKDNGNFTPRLFYFNSITGDFLATEVEYPLRSNKHISAFPFLQTHLYTATQPALFLLDNDSEIWLWQGWNTEDSNLELFRIEEDLAKKTALEFSKEKEKSNGISVPIKCIRAGLEPGDFINIFPYWEERKDIAELQIKEGHQAKVTIIYNIGEHDDSKIVYARHNNI